MKPIDDFIARERDNPGTHERIEIGNANDNMLYKHVSEVLYPRWVADYGETLTPDVESFNDSCQEAGAFRQDSLMAKARRNLVLKPMRKVLFPDRNALSRSAA